MKKLTKTLSLVLVVAMVLSLCVIGAGATFTDNDKITKDYSEAVAVMTDLGCVSGVGNNTFAPAGTFTRAQAAVILTRLTLGASADNYVPSKVSFSDVPTTFWGYKFVEYAAQSGYVAGVGNGKYNPNATLTGYQWAAMLLKVLNITVPTTGSDWQINTAKAYYGEDQFSTVTISAANVTREAATQMAYDALFYTSNGKTGYPVKDSTGAVVAVYDTVAEATMMKTALGTGYTIGTAIVTIGGTTLAKSVFGVTEGSGNDSFGRPSNVYSVTAYNAVKNASVAKTYGWTVSNSRVFSNAPVYSSTTGFNLKATAFQKAYSITTDTVVYYNGKVQADKGASINGGTAIYTDFANGAMGELYNNGTCVEMYGTMNAKGVYVVGTIVVYEYNVAVVSGISTAKATAGDITLTVSYARPTTSGVQDSGTFTKTVDVSATDDVNVSNYAALKDYTKGTVLLTCWQGGNGDLLLAAYKPTAVTGTVAATHYSVSTGYEATRYFKLDNGTSYTLANVRDQGVKPALADKGTFYFDANGYFVAADTTASVYTNYAYVYSTQYDFSSSLITTSTAAVAQIRTTDGKVATVNLAYTNSGTTSSPVYTIDTLPVAAVSPAVNGTVTANAATSGNGTTNAKTTVGSWFAYTVDANGNYLFQALNSHYAKQVSSMTVVSSPRTTTADGMYFTSATTLNVFSDTAAVQTTYTGYTTFPANTYSNVLYTYTQDSTTASAVYASVTTATTTASYAYVTAMGDTVAKGTYYTVYIDGTETSVLVPTNSSLTVGTIYEGLVINSTNVLTSAGTTVGAVSVDATTNVVSFTPNGGSATTGTKVTVAEAGYFVASTAYTYPATGAVVYNVTGTDMTKATLAIGNYVAVISAANQVADLVLVIG